jgi:hypothetical protein
MCVSYVCLRILTLSYPVLNMTCLCCVSLAIVSIQCITAAIVFTFLLIRKIKLLKEDTSCRSAGRNVQCQYLFITEIVGLHLAPKSLYI